MTAVERGASDYAAEVARTRRAQGLPERIPKHQIEAVAALLGQPANDEKQKRTPPTTS